MVIVAGWLRVEAAHRSEYLEASRDVVHAARDSAGCLDFCISADLIDAERINVFEHWESVEAVEAFRGDGVPDELATMIIDAHVEQHTIDASARLA